MIADRDFNFSDYISTNSQQREMALCCEERIRSHILDSDYNSGLLLRAVAHQLMIYISSFILRHENMEHELSTKDFPYLPGNYWQQPDSIKFNKKSYMPIFSYSLSNKCFVEYTGSYKVHLPYRILNKFITFISIYWLALKKKQKKNFNLEKNFISGEKVLRLCLKDLAVDIEIPKKDKKIFINNFIAYVESYVNFFCSETNNLLYSGTLCKIISSSRAFAYSCEKLPVIVEDHGDFSTLLHDEPATRLGEIGLSTVLKTYGDIEWIGKILNNQKHLISKPEIVQISSNHLEGIKRKKSIKNNSTIRNKKLLYVPTAFSSYFRYLPYRDYTDDFYLAWQKLLLNKLSELGYTTDYKIHPKNKVKLFNGKNKIITKRLSHVNFEEYDAIIVDYVSTGLSQAIYSSRPVWFFDTGLRKMQPYFYEHFLRRGIKPINFKGDISAQIENIIKIYDSEDKLYNVRLR